MTVSIVHDAAAAPHHLVSAVRPRRLTLALVAGCAAGIVAVFAWTPAAASVPADAGLATLLRGMAMLKAVFVAGAAALLSWRFRRPLSTPLAVGYLLSLWTLTTASALIWRSSSLAAAALLFHAAGLALLVLAARDERILPEPRGWWSDRRGQR